MPTDNPPPPGPSSTPAPSENRPPDAIWAPWRLGYLESLDESGPPARPDSPTGCFLSDDWLAPDDDIANHVIVRTDAGMILLNAYPYANGHLLVALGDGRASLMDYAPEQRAALWRLVDTACELMQAALEPQGINIGVNQGRAAGAGVPGHLHVHLVPRWSGDVNFITAVGNIRVIPSALEQMDERYRRAWDKLKGS